MRAVGGRVAATPLVLRGGVAMAAAPPAWLFRRRLHARAPACARISFPAMAELPLHGEVRSGRRAQCTVAAVHSAWFSVMMHENMTDGTAVHGGYD